MHRENPTLQEIVYPVDEEQNLVGIVNDINQSFTFYQKISKDNPNIEVRQMVRGTPYFYLTTSDQMAVVVQYLYSETWGNGPVWECRNDSKLYSILKDEFETLWNFKMQAMIQNL